MIDLAVTSPRGAQHVVDLPYRLCSWSLDDPENIALWVDDRGRLVAWAVLQVPFWTIDIVVRPDGEAELFPAALEWAMARARTAQETPSGHPSWFVHVFADQTNRSRQLESFRFACQANVGADSWEKVSLQCDRLEPSSVSPPEGFAIRPLAGLAEVEEYVDVHRAAFGSENMTVAWRTKTLSAPHHVPDTDLVAVAEDGRLAGFCVGWLSQEERATGQIEPLGVAPAFHGLGLGAVLLTECLRRLADRGAARVMVETDKQRSPALPLYRHVGFRPIREILVYRKDLEAQPAEA